MTKQASHTVVPGIDLNRITREPLGQQLYGALRSAILAGRFRAGSRLPSTRGLSADLKVSRNTVLGAYEQLLIEGYLEAKVGSGTSVASSLPDEMLCVRTPAVFPGSQASRGSLSRRGRILADRPVRLLSVPGTPRPFASGHPDVAAFPIKTWIRLTGRRWRRQSDELLVYGDPAGYRPLRQAIASYVRTARAVRCEAEQVVVVTGSQQAIDLIARLLIDPGDAALVEDPGYPGARAALTAAGATLVRLPVDAEGANIRRVRTRRAKIRLAFVTPSHQYPLGVTMTLPRRLSLLEWARQHSAWILEDDYDSDYRYRGKPLPSLQGLDNSGQVIYMGSFSKTMLPSLRLGFLVLPDRLVEPFRRARAVVDGHSPVPFQAVLADFISEGHFARHIRRMRTLYQERQSVLLDAAERSLSGLLEVNASEGGMHLMAWLPRGVSDITASQRLRSSDIYASPFSFCCTGKPKRGGLLLGYAAFTSVQINEAVKRLATVLRHVVRLT